jgi:hypothetical protein
MMFLAPLLLLSGPSDIVVSDQSGHMVAPFAMRPAEPTVLFYVMQGCPISAKYSPEVGRLVRDYPRVRFFLVQVDKKATAAQARSHQSQFHIPCPELLDPKYALVHLGGPDTVPTAVLFGTGGEVRYKGRIDDRFPALGVELSTPRRKDLRIALDQLLAGKAITVSSTPVIGCALPPG